MKAKEEIQKILDSNDPKDIKALFVFDSSDSDEKVLFKFNLWARYYLSKYFTSKDAPFHKQIDSYNLKCYREKFTFVNIAFRGAAKTARTKLFVAYCIANDIENSRKYFKVLSQDGNNSKQIVTDIYNILITTDPYLFAKGHTKREETMSSFTTSTGVKILADTVGTNQRGALQEESRPDFIWFEDFEDRTTLRSAVKTKAIWDNMEEARTSLSKDGSCLYSCNYVSEAGNVHKLVTKGDSDNRKVLIIPIINNEGVISWDRYQQSDIDQMREEDDDFEGERLCVKPDTLVYTDKGLIEISKLKVDDLVWTHKNRLQKIKTVFQSQAKDLLDITVDDKITTMTKNHPVLVKRGALIDWLPAGELLITDLIVQSHQGQ